MRQINHTSAAWRNPHLPGHAASTDDIPAENAI
jgi:hypothetical protein